MTDTVGRKAFNWLTYNVVNPVALRLTRRGIAPDGQCVVEVRGRTSGEPRHTVVNLLRLDGGTYLVAPRGQTQWVRNVRALDDGRIATLRGHQRTEWVATELHGPAVVPVLRAYLKAWAWEVGVFFPKGISAASSDADLVAIADRYPVFRLESPSV